MPDGVSKDEMETMDSDVKDLWEAAKAAEEASAAAAATFQAQLQERLHKKRKSANGEVPGREDAERIKKEADDAAAKAAEQAG